MQKVFIGSIKDGKLSLDRVSVQTHIESLPDGNIEVCFRDMKRYRTDDQNRLYWDLLSELEKFTSTEKGYWHTFFKYLFIPETITYRGKCFGFTCGSTQNLDKKDFSEYYSHCEQWIVENIPDFIFPKYETNT